ncbi:MAG: hypothetical protein COT26_00895 [Candidatus Kerfeldbacteria bacterium CG08_land_8_20_14_0_20_43_14]|uniref:Uncharacterized protein n=1 Tax=Candidatus Kerfeldbacteria bacterium CG08_land_8_20_14_0_20_43_14 TaxID=2014246 RepID=A0A2H0YQW6_9BACT|nr:MAG: hypothetical protein COT26_00895 [Candidatus Kerfeldbacteria bacterium CG08_land_8_20_14_0_20_43_14]
MIVVGGASAVLIIRNNDAKNTTATDVKTGQSTEVKTGSNAIIDVVACDVLTETAAKNIFGDAAVKGDLPAASQISTKDVPVNNCVYTAKIDPAVAVRDEAPKLFAN